MVNWTKVSYILGGLVSVEIILLIRKHWVQKSYTMNSISDKLERLEDGIKEKNKTDAAIDDKIRYYSGGPLTDLLMKIQTRELVLSARCGLAPCIFTKNPIIFKTQMNKLR